MIHTTLPYNPVISYMKYSNETLTMGFKSKYERIYKANQELAYRIYFIVKQPPSALKILIKLRNFVQ